MQPKVHAHDDGSVTISITLPRASDELSMLAQEGRLMEAVNAVGRAGARHLLGGFDAQGQPLLHAGRKWTSKGKVAKFYETPWGEVLLERHLYQHSGGGVTLCPLEERARIVGGTATPHLARSLGHKYANANARAVVRDLEENHARKLAPSYVADIAQAIAEAAGQPFGGLRTFGPWSSKMPMPRRARPARLPAPCSAWMAPAPCSARRVLSNAWWAPSRSTMARANAWRPSIWGRLRRRERRSSSTGSMASGSASANAIPKPGAWDSAMARGTMSHG